MSDRYVIAVIDLAPGAPVYPRSMSSLSQFAGRIGDVVGVEDATVYGSLDDLLADLKDGSLVLEDASETVAGD